MRPEQVTFAPQFKLALPGDVQPGDLWRVASVEAGLATFERVEAEPGTFRSRQDGLRPRLPDARPVTDEEARRCADEMDAAMAAHAGRLEAWAFSPDNPINQALSPDSPLIQSLLRADAEASAKRVRR